MYTINVSFEQPGQAQVILHNIVEGQSLLEVLLKNGIEMHHKCGGVCACSTCHLYVIRGEIFLEEISKKEKDYIKRAVNPKPISRLGCQCLLLGGGEEVEIILPDQTKISSEEC